ncbi:saccharopine dehydrogenase family protein [Kineococcus rhizosphaerae]|uniref:Saccharopine dehydrogenase-like NADP-dependent oxidoreductase n=1 Tax=Kineococcus rhizosphaerae TaxID=559628 RepID=A0A2T0QUT5_9ACTN|nr:saccharopine dehydrogenase NADP-binding domain-containing protein [Kineococcus rhizosphaerae]PRY08930.1 saccharopine dehydrogenase-like NADP-dependent oxidoreductase [Kineococcus rhizosphaerae]
MRVVALGGSGAMGRQALTTLSRIASPDEIVVADRNGRAAEETARHLLDAGQTARAVELDVTDTPALLRLLEDADVVLNTVGPFFKFGVPILRAAIASRTRYYDICDDPEPTAEMLGLHAEAEAAGVTAVIGAGASPGFMNILGRLATGGLDEVHDIATAWSFNSSYQDWDLLRSFNGQSEAALEHFFEQVTGTVTTLEEGVFVESTPLEPVEIDIPGLGQGTGYVVGHPEPITFRDSFSVTGGCRSLCLMTADRAAEFSILAGKIESGEISVAEATRLLVDRDTEIGRRAQAEAPRFRGVGDLPIYFVAATGTRDGQSVTQFAATRNKPEPMAIGTGVPLAVAAATGMGQVLPAGVFPPERVLNPEPFLTLVAEHWGVPRSELLYQGSVTHERVGTGV